MTYGYIAALVFQGAYFVALARELHVTQFGDFAAGLAMVSVLTPFAGWGSGNALVMHVSRDSSMFPKRLGESLVLIVATGVVFSSIAWAVSCFVFGTNGAITEIIVPVALAELVFGSIMDLCAQCFQAHEKLVWTAQITVGESAVRLCAMAFLVFDVVPQTLAAWAWLYLGAAVVWTACSVVAVMTKLGRPLPPRLSRRLFTRTGFYFAVGQASKTIYSDIDKTMLARLDTAAVTGFYTAGYRVIGFALAPIKAAVYALNARMFRDGEKGAAVAWALVRRMLPAVCGFAIAAGVAVYLLAPTVPILLGSGYDGAVPVLRWLSLLPLIEGLHYVLGDAIMGLGHQGKRSALQLGTAGLNVVLNLILIPRYSWRGALVSTFVAEVALAVGLALAFGALLKREQLAFTPRTAQ